MEDQQKSKLFREKSLKAIESPEALNDYLRVTSPGVWLVLAAVIATAGQHTSHALTPAFMQFADFALEQACGFNIS